VVSNTVKNVEGAVYTTLETDLLDFDPNNPRLGGAGVNKTTAEIQEVLETAPHYARELVGSIVQNGFVPYEPLVVRQVGDKYQVIEGNRRLAAVRHIRANKDGKYSLEVVERLKRLPVLLFPSAHDEKDVQVYLGVKHMFGFREWPAASKAIYLDKRISSKEDIEEVSRQLEIDRDEIVRWLIPYRLRESAQSIFRLIKPEHFWSLAESFGRGGIKPYIELKYDANTLRITHYNPRKLRFLAEFLYGERVEDEAKVKDFTGKRRIRETRDLSKLGKVLSNETARQKLEKGSSLEDALVYVEPKNERVQKQLKALDSTFRKLLGLRPNSEELSSLKSLLEGFLQKLKARV
jgi:hypothetical protein